jgi:hypothetical protein
MINLNERKCFNYINKLLINDLCINETITIVLNRLNRHGLFYLFDISYLNWSIKAIIYILFCDYKFYR